MRNVKRARFYTEENHCFVYEGTGEMSDEDFEKATDNIGDLVSSNSGYFAGFLWSPDGKEDTYVVIPTRNIHHVTLEVE